MNSDRIEQLEFRDRMVLKGGYEYEPTKYLLPAHRLLTIKLDGQGVDVRTDSLLTDMPVKPGQHASEQLRYPLRTWIWGERSRTPLPFDDTVVAHLGWMDSGNGKVLCIAARDPGAQRVLEVAHLMSAPGRKVSAMGPHRERIWLEYECMENSTYGCGHNFGHREYACGMTICPVCSGNNLRLLNGVKIAA